MPRSTREKSTTAICHVMQGKESNTSPHDSRVRLYPDGKYRWVYEVSMLKNPSILADVFKVLGISMLVVWLFCVAINAYDGDLSLDSLGNLSSVFLLLAIAISAIGCIAYLIVAWYYGWKYVVLFTMDKKEVVHQQMSHQVEKAQLLGALTALVGGAAGKSGMAGTGLLASSHTTTTSTLANVKSLVPVRRRNLIKVNQLLHKNRVYVNDEDFAFVYDFLCQYCTNAEHE